MKYYYGYRKLKDGSYRGVVYHYDKTGNEQIKDYVGPDRENLHQATDDAAEWSEGQSEPDIQNAELE